MDIKTYSSKQVLISLGSHSVEGPADGDFLSIEPNSEGFTRVVGAYGEVVRSVSPDETYTLALTLLMQSPTVAWCQNQFDRDRATGDGMFPILVKDMKGGIIFSAEQAWIVNSPAVTYGIEASTREITIHTGAGTYRY